MMTNCLTLKKSNCKNCYKCIRNCPVKSIRFSGNQAHIINDECILCGRCFVVCPQNAKQIVDEVEKVKVLLSSNEKVIVSLAPSFIANYEGVGIEGMRKALKQLGFYDVEETAIGATIVKNEYLHLIEEEEQDVIISSCCHSVNLLVQKYFPKLINSLANILSPMLAHGYDIKKRYPEAKCVFIGPCVSKKDEAAHYVGSIDAVLTFEELTNWLKEKHIELEKHEEYLEKSKARLFPTTGGILKTMGDEVNGYKYLAVDGVENCINALKDIEDGKIHHCFIEMSSCVGSCIGGPVMEKNHHAVVRDYLAIVRNAGLKDFEVDQPKSIELRKPFKAINHELEIPTEEQIQEILHRMNKFKPSDELNCGSCGYNTCREKAIAIFRGKAEISMCLPFLKDRAEKFTDTIVDNTPNGIVVLNDNYEVQQINKAALRMMNIRHEQDVLGDQVVRIMDPNIFIEVSNNKQNIINRKVYMAEYQKYVNQSVIFDNSSNLFICIMKDITEEENDKIKKETISQQTIETTDKVIEKQMRIVQQIASLLGETAAETKIALTKLKESIKDE